MPVKFGNPVVGGSVLRRPAIQSPGYVPGSAGWTVNIDGSAEFNNLSLRGTFYGTDYVINSLGAFFYSGPPAAGNLIASIAPAAGSNDGQGNAFRAGFTVYSANSWMQLQSALLAMGVTGVTTTSQPSIGPDADGTSLDISSGGTSPSKTDKTILKLIKGHQIGTDSVTVWDPVAGFPTLETWHTMTLQNSFAVGVNASNGASDPPQYKLLPDGQLALRGNLASPPTGTVLGVAFAQLPSPYANTTAERACASLAQNSGAHSGGVAVDASASLFLWGGFSNSMNIQLDCRLGIK